MDPTLDDYSHRPTFSTMSQPQGHEVDTSMTETDEDAALASAEKMIPRKFPIKFGPFDVTSQARQFPTSP
jgi:hypothetical protein